MTEDALILEEYRKVFRKYAARGIINLDEHLPRKFNFRVYRIEDLMQGLDGVLPATRLSQYFISFLKTGKGEKTVGRYHFPLRQNTLFVVPKNIPHSSRYQGGKRTGYSVSFNIDFFLQTVFPSRHMMNRDIFKATTIPYLVLQDDQALKVTGIYEYLLEEFNADRPNRSELLAVKTLELLILCDRYFTGANHQPSMSSNPLAASFVELVQQHFVTEKSVKFYADALHVHANHLNFVVKKYTGLTAKQTIDEQVLLEAKALLRSTDLSVKEIAYRLGFEEPNRFTSFFRKREHTSPTLYKHKV